MRGTCFNQTRLPSALCFGGGAFLNLCQVRDGPSVELTCPLWRQRPVEKQVISMPIQSEATNIALSSEEKSLVPSVCSKKFFK